MFVGGRVPPYAQMWVVAYTMLEVLFREVDDVGD
jgi:hypothetical protein